MKGMSQIRRHYDKFTVPERDQLLLAALQREDWEQIRVLLERCSDADSLSQLWTTVVLGNIAHSLVIHMLACDALFFRSLTLQCFPHPNDLAPGAAPDPKPLPKAAALPKAAPLMENAAAAWFGFVAWCQTAGYDPHQLLTLALLGEGETDPARDLINWQIGFFESRPLPPDELQVDRWQTAFTCLFWRLALGPE